MESFQISNLAIYSGMMFIGFLLITSTFDFLQIIGWILFLGGEALLGVVIIQVCYLKKYKTVL